jgi:hypothetical protein
MTAVRRFVHESSQMVIPVQIWGHALRIWLAAVTALYVAFWLQLGGSSAAVTVAILAQPTRGAALAKAVNRIAATFIGAAMSIVIAGLFPGERVGLLAAFILWMCVCVFVASYFRGFRAYAAVLSGYTVGIITVVSIGTPQRVFTTMTDRVAAIDGNAKMAEAALASAKAALAQADINLQRTEVRSPVDGYVTNLLMRVGDSARAGTPNLSVIDEKSYWIDAYFEETKLAKVHVGDDVEATLLSYAVPIKGRIESITGGISAESSTQGLPNVDPIFTWVRLAQRIPVRTRIDQAPQDVPLIAGMTCSVSVVGGKQAPAPKHVQGIFNRLISRLG